MAKCKCFEIKNVHKYNAIGRAVQHVDNYQLVSESGGVGESASELAARSSESARECARVLLNFFLIEMISVTELFR